MIRSLLYLITFSMIAPSVFAEIFVKSVLKEHLTQRDTNAVERAGAKWLRDHDRRNLRRSPPRWCSYWCQGFPCGQCFLWIRDCWGYCPRGRGLEKEQGVSPEELPRVRELSREREECLEKIDEAMFIMERAISDEGEPIVEASDFTCYQRIIEAEEETSCEGELVSWNMWDATHNEMIFHNFQDTPSICKSEMRKSNLEAAVDCDDDIKQVDFEITGPESYFYDRTERQALFFLYGNRNDNVYRTNHEFAVGNYEVSATIVKRDGSSMTQRLFFSVGDC